MVAMKFTRIIWMMMIGAMILQTAEAQRRPRIISPEVKSDRSATFRLSEGGYTWKNWRHYLHEFFQLIFK